MKRPDVEKWLARRGWSNRPVWPHLYYKDARPNERFKLTELGIRLETRLSFGEWMRLKSAYYKDLSVDENGRLAGMKTRGMR